jgi:hypothetical protein
MTLVSTLAEFSLTKCGEDAMTCVISTPGTWVDMTVVELDAALPLICVPLFEVFLAIDYTNLM